MLLNDNPALVGKPLPAMSVAAMLWIAAAMLAPFVLYFATAQSIVRIWNSSETFAHGYIILPISLWLVWRRRANFSVLPPTPWWPALALLALLGAGWTLASMGGVSVVMQYAFVAMIPVVALAVLGWRLAWSLAFPLLFLLFAVPFGEIFIAPLIDFTADFTVWAVQTTGIPVLRNGTRFELPSGSWSVVEACSGVRYLISSVTIGCLYAYLTYRSSTRRLVFVALAIVAPILANGLRAYMIVMIGHTSDMTLATGVDHLIYGWVFFGIVMFLMFWIGSHWRQDQESETPTAAPRVPTQLAPIRNMALAVIATCVLWPALALYNDAVTHNPNPVRIDTVPVSWAPVAAFSGWIPNYMAADAGFNGVYQPAAGGTPVALTLLYYRNQAKDKALISSGNRMTADKDRFFELGSAMRSEQFGARMLALRETRLENSAGNLLVWHWVWVDGQATTSDYKGKLLQARAKLMFRGDDGAAVMVSAPLGEDREQARAALRAFIGEHLAPIEATLAAARGQ